MEPGTNNGGPPSANLPGGGKRSGAKLIRVLAALAAVIAAPLLLLAVFRLADTALNPKREKIDYRKNTEGAELYSAASDGAETSPDAGYAEANKEVFFFDGSFGEYLTEEDAGRKDARGLMYNYFDALKTGDAAKHASLLSGDYRKNFVVQEKFTPQMVYDIKVELRMFDFKDGKLYEGYRVVYGIHRNDGSYRADMASDTPTEMYFYIVYEGDRALLNAIVRSRTK